MAPSASLFRKLTCKPEAAPQETSGSLTAARLKFYWLICFK